jgi:exopolyphosphatase/guanosine-5'-triphosphate,3'-diphosphate pyrophosphatase
MRAAVDIGTNSMRVLVVDDDGVERHREARVTGLGRGVDRAGRLSEDAVDRTLAVLSDYGALMRAAGVDRVRAVATSATRDAANRDEFLNAAEHALGVRPETISGLEEAGLAFVGATEGITAERPHLVVDIGGGSTEFVRRDGDRLTAVSVDIGSVRLTDRMLSDRPVAFDQLEAAMRHVESLFVEEVGDVPSVGTVIGVAGTWTSLAAITLGLPAYDRDVVHHSILERLQLDRLVERLAGMSIEETAKIPSLDPARAPVILSGAVVAREAMRLLGVSSVLVSEHDLLDGIVAAL